MERVYKSLMGYKPENDKNDATHVILTINEYYEFMREISALRDDLKLKTGQYASDLKKFQEDTNKEVLDIKNRATEVINNYKKELAQSDAEINRLNDLNKNLIRIQTERANARRGLVPKKAHHGYRVLDSQQYTYIYRYKVGSKIKTENYPCWKVRVQSPYDASIPFKTIVKDLYNDLIKVYGVSLDINSIFDVDRKTHDEFKELWKENKNSIFKSSYKANIRSGLWEIEYLVKSSITVPEHMRIPRSESIVITKKEDF